MKPLPSTKTFPDEGGNQGVPTIGPEPVHGGQDQVKAIRKSKPTALHQANNRNTSQFPCRSQDARLLPDRDLQRRYAAVQLRGVRGLLWEILSQDTHEEAQNAPAWTGWVGPTEYQADPIGTVRRARLQEASSGVGIDPIFLVQLEI